MANKLLSAEKKSEELKSLFTTDMESGNWMSSKKDELQSTKKMGILGEDSEKYKNVLIYLENINSMLDTKLSGEIKKMTRVKWEMHN